jgi:hypothetical protein
MNDILSLKLITHELIPEKNGSLSPIIHNKKSLKNKVPKIKLTKEQMEEVVIKWRLFKFVGAFKEDGGAEFFPWASVQKLSDGITEEIIAEVLNKENVFDFDYVPAKNDYLKLVQNYTYEDINCKQNRPFIGYFISFLFDGEKWVVNQGFDHIHLIHEDFKEGIVNYQLTIL